MGANANEEAALAGIGELIFSLLIGYLGALEFAFVARQLYHWSAQHPNADAVPDSEEELARFRQRLDREITEAAEREAVAGTNVMQDGVCYSNGFRVDPKGDLAIELERQQKIEEETRRQLAEAEDKLRQEQQQRKKAEQKEEEEEQRQRQRKIKEEEKEKAEAERQREAAENQRKLIEAEKQREESERLRQEREEAEERERLRQEAEENERKLIAAERLRQQQQQQLEDEENERKLLAAEQERQRILAEEEIQRHLFERHHRGNDEEEEEEDDQAQRDAEIVERLLAAERERKFSATESELEEEALLEEQSRRLLSSKSDLETKQKLIEENARRFLEAEEEMVVLQQRMLQAAQKQDDDDQYLGLQPVEEELCIKKTMPPRFQEPPDDEEPALVVQKVKTQYGQTSGSGIVEEPYLMKSQTLTFPGVSDEGSSIEPNSSQQSSFSTQPSEAERPEPEGEDYIPDVQYTEDYLRSLDGIKSRPLVREDGSGRRRAFKKRRSSGSSNSSRDSRTSREEELKMFTSLEEEELKHGDREDYNPIKYSSEPTLRVKQQHHRRHKRSPAKDTKPSVSSGEAAGALEMLGEENTSPWGEVVPEHYKDTEFWKREKALSIDEEELELDKHASGEEVIEQIAAKMEPKASSFEEASKEQNLEAASALSTAQQLGKEKDKTESTSSPSASSSDNKSNLQTSTSTEEHSRTSPGLRRSPRIDEMVQYEERWSASHTPEPPTPESAPTIAVHQPDTAPWRDQYGLLMEGISDFYDFTASVNPSRSRSTSRNPSPQPKNVAHEMDVDNDHTLEVYDDTQDGLPAGEVTCEAVLQLLESTMSQSNDNESIALPLQNVADDAKNGQERIVPMVFEALGSELMEQRQRDCRSRSRSRSPLPTSENLERSISKRREKLIKQNDELMERLSNSPDLSGRNSPMEVVETNNHDRSPPEIVVLPQPVIEINDLAGNDEPMESMEDEAEQPSREQMRLFVEAMRAERNSRSKSRSRSRSPLPTSDNIAKSLETRRLKRIQQNDELFEKLHIDEDHEQVLSSPPAVIPVIEIIEAPCEEESEAVAEADHPEPVDTPESMAKLFEQLRLNRARSTHSRSRSRSPLPSAANLEQSLQKRREKMIAQNDMLFEQLQERARTPEPEGRLTVEYVYEIVEEPEHTRDMRSLSPSRSRSRSRSRSQTRSPSSEKDFHLMLNLEGSDQRTLLKHNEEWETMLAGKTKQRAELDLEALQKLRNANEEIELRVLSPTASECEQLMPDYGRTESEVARDLQDELKANDFKRSTYVGESLDLAGIQGEEDRYSRRSASPMLDVELAREQAVAQRELQAAILDSITENRHGAKPKTSEYERTFSEELKDTKRMQEESINSGFKRSTYVGESLDLSQLDDLRHRSAEFQRSRSQSRSPLRDDEDIAALKNIESEVARRDMQDQLLDQLAASSVNFENFSRHLNADFLDSERRASDSALDSYGGGDLEPEEYHHFRRYSLAQEQPVEEYPSDDDYVYISQIEVRTLTGTRTWLKEDFYTLEPENYAELNRLALREDYNGEDEVKDERSWAQAVLAAEAEAAEFDATNAIYNFDIIGGVGVGGGAGGADGDEISSNDSEDERQTVVEIDDEEYEFELDEGISDYNERTQPTDESHHDTSECEEAERNTDRYANRRAQDWDEVDDVEDCLGDGAVGGATPYSDPDSFIEQIYTEAIRNRKQSGILREYETMVQEQLPESADHSESDKEKSSSDSERRYALWAKTRELNNKSPRQNDVDIALGLTLERDNPEMRYLGDAHVAARQSARLRTRYGYNPQLQVNALEDDLEVDMNYIPKREYNWRKNFKLDDNEDDGEASHRQHFEMAKTEEGNGDERDEGDEGENGMGDAENELEDGEPFDHRRFSFGGESITLFSRSPVREVLPDVVEETVTELDHTLDEEREKVIEELKLELELKPELQPELEPDSLPMEKPKKKKSKKKLRKSHEEENDNDSDNQTYGLSAPKEDMTEKLLESTKRKSRSRRSSKSSLTTADEANGGPFSPRGSLALMGESLENIAELVAPETETFSSLKKKTKKRKKVSKEQNPEPPSSSSLLDEALNAALAELGPVSVSTNLTPESTQQNLLAIISTGQSRCLTPASSIEEHPAPEPESALEPNPLPARSVIDTFDILKDANFYPLF